MHHLRSRRALGWGTVSAGSAPSSVTLADNVQVVDSSVYETQPPNHTAPAARRPRPRGHGLPSVHPARFEAASLPSSLEKQQAGKQQEGI